MNGGKGISLLAALGAAWAGCGGGLYLADLPPDPIAVRYFDPEQARRAQEELAELELSQRGGSGRSARSRAGVASLEDFNQFLSSSFRVRRGSLDNGNRRDANQDSPKLALLDPRTRALTVLPHAGAGSVPVDWSADRRFLLFTQIRDGYDQLFEYDRERGEVRPITHEPGAHAWGCYASDGRIVAERVAFDAEPPRSHLVISNSGGGQFRDLTSGPSDQRPACSPDGTRVAYIAGGRGIQGIVTLRSLIAAQAGPPREVGQGIDPSFSPDGNFIVYAAATRVQMEFGYQNRWRLRRARVSGLGRGSFEMGPTDQFEPAVSPDGKIVAYIGIDPEFNQVLYVRRIDGTGERILFNDGAALGPVW